MDNPSIIIFSRSEATFFYLSTQLCFAEMHYLYGFINKTPLNRITSGQSNSMLLSGWFSLAAHGNTERIASDSVPANTFDSTKRLILLSVLMLRMHANVKDVTYCVNEQKLVRVFVLRSIEFDHNCRTKNRDELEACSKTYV